MPRRNDSQPIVSVETCHDRKGLRLTTHDDCVEITLDEATTLVEKLREQIEIAKRRLPPAPAPIDWSSEWRNEEIMKAFAECGHWHNGDGCIYIAKYEVGIDGAIELRDWLDKAIKYHTAPEAPT